MPLALAGTLHAAMLAAARADDDDGDGQAGGGDAGRSQGNAARVSRRARTGRRRRRRRPQGARAASARGTQGRRKAAESDPGPAPAAARGAAAGRPAGRTRRRSRRNRCRRSSRRSSRSPRIRAIAPAFRGSPTPAPPQETDSHGPGAGGGTGTGQGTGLGEGEGAGIGPGSGGGTGGGPYRPGSGITAPSILREVKPDYTEEGRRRNIEGDVVLEIVVRRDGTVGSVKLLQGLGAGPRSARDRGRAPVALLARQALRHARRRHRRSRDGVQTSLVVRVEYVGSWRLVVRA